MLYFEGLICWLEQTPLRKGVGKKTAVDLIFVLQQMDIWYDK